jgi:hypothetical protein
MLLLPVANPLRVLSIPEIILVFELGQPGPLALTLAGLSAVGLGTETLTQVIAVIGKKMFLAVEAFASALLSLHWFPKSKELESQNAKNNGKENPRERTLRMEKKE